jgi:hypothetical protein
MQFAQDVYNPQFIAAEDGSTIQFSAALQPVLVEAPAPRPPQRFEFNDDPRNGETTIQKIHSGRRDAPRATTAAPKLPAKAAPAKRTPAHKRAGK